MKYRTPVQRGALALATLLAVAAPERPRAQEVEAQEPNRGGVINLETRDPAVALQRLRAAEGYEVTLFASEQDFPIEKPVALAWDARGRLWVSTMPTYPHYLPGSPPNDKLVILEDTNGDGRADKHTVFADSLYLPVGFELGDGGVYVSQQPNLVFLRDTNGDDVADERRVILHGFGTEDSHHSIHSFTWGPDGALYFQEGTFHHSQVETPYGPVRLFNAGVFRYEPHTEKLSVYVSYPFSNPWGHVFDRWGQNVIADASSGHNMAALPISGRVEYPNKHSRVRLLTPITRPTAGAEFVSSRQFPDEAQGNFLFPNTIGFQGIKSFRTTMEGSGPVMQETPPLLVSSDINFRPIDMEFGPDGALYFVDWFNPLVGHMQYSLRDERRDREHGRVYRIAARGRPLLAVTDLTRLSTAQLLDQLKQYEDRTRYRARRELRERDRDEVRRELDRWVRSLNRADPEYQHHLLEALWVKQSRDLVDTELLGRLLRSEDHRARAAATRVLRYWRDRVDPTLALLRGQANDEHPLVRLEAVVALSDVRSAEAAEIALEALKRPTDYYLEFGLGETITALQDQWKPVFTSGRAFAADNPAGVLYLLDRLAPAEVATVMRTETVNRELLVRRGIALSVREEAMGALARSGRRSTAAVLMDAIAAVAARTDLGPVVPDLVTLLGRVPAEELRPVRGALEALARSATDARLRQSAYVALMRADGGVDRAWTLASASDAGLVDLLAGVTALREPALQAAIYPRVRDLLRERLARPAAGEMTLGRYVRIEQPGPTQTLSLAEVEVLDGPVNLAIDARAEQKSTAAGGEAERAIDGNTGGLFRDASVSQSTRETDPWWEVDLGETRPLSEIRIWKRTDEGNGTGRVTVRVLDSQRRPVITRQQVDTTAQPIAIDLGGGDAAVRRAAVRALAALPGAEAERLSIFRDLLARGIDRELAVEGMEALLAGGWRGGDVVAVPGQLLAYARSIPGTDRSGASFERTAALARALGSALPDSLMVTTVRMRAVEAAMRFDLPSFSVQAGREVEIVFENPDEMPHNVVVTAPGAAERVGRAADAMSARPDGFEKNFIPDTPEVLFATKLINRGESVTLRFRAPTEPGAYPYICSFPTHWVTMIGTMQVTAAAR